MDLKPGLRGLDGLEGGILSDDLPEAAPPVDEIENRGPAPVR